MIRKGMFLAAALWAGVVAAATPAKVVFDVQNITCAACGLTIEMALRRVPGVSETRVDADNATVTVAFDADRTSGPAVAKAISDAGFPAKARHAGG